MVLDSGNISIFIQGGLQDFCCQPGEEPVGGRGRLGVVMRFSTISNYIFFVTRELRKLHRAVGAGVEPLGPGTKKKNLGRAFLYPHYKSSSSSS